MPLLRPVVRNSGYRFYTYAFPMSLNARDAAIGMNTLDFLNNYYQPNLEDFRFNSQSTQCILNKEQDNGN